MIRWIRERLGTAPHDAALPGSVSVVDVRHLVDKTGNSPESILELVRRGVEAYRAGGTVVVACDFGVSRSNAIAAGILGTLEGVSFDDAMREVVRATGESEVKLDVASAVRAALEQSAGGIASSDGAVMITGANGFLGHALVAGLRGHREVFGPTRAEMNLESGSVALADACRRAGVAQIVHLAFPRVYTNAGAAASALTALRNVLDVCRLLSIRLVFVSGWVVYAGYPTLGLLVDESVPLRPKGVYGETKYLEEALVDLHFQRGDVDRSICRLAPVYGPEGDRPRLIKTFFAAASRDQQVVTHRYRNGRPALDLLYVDDAADALARVVAAESNVFHFGRGDLRTTAGLATTIASIAGRPLQHAEIEIDDDASNVILDSRKASRLLGWSPKVSVEEGLRRTLRA